MNGSLVAVIAPPAKEKYLHEGDVLGGDVPHHRRHHEGRLCLLRLCWQLDEHQGVAFPHTFCEPVAGGFLASERTAPAVCVHAGISAPVAANCPQQWPAWRALELPLWLLRLSCAARPE